MINRPSSFEELVSLYGHPKDFGLNESTKSQWEQKHMTLWTSNKWMSKNIPLMWPIEIPFTKIYCNKDLIEPLDNAFTNLIQRGLIGELKTYDGSWMIRPIRGTTDKWSVHCFSMAIDFNAKENPLGGPVTFSDEFITAMKDAEFIAGVDFSRKDGMHFQYASGC